MQLHVFKYATSRQLVLYFIPVVLSDTIHRKACLRLNIAEESDCMVYACAGNNDGSWEGTLSLPLLVTL